MALERTKYLLAALCIVGASACGGGGDSSGGSSASQSPALGAALPDESGIGFLQTQLEVAENQRVLEVIVFRAGEAEGDASVAYSVTGETASSDTDFIPVSGTLTWLSGETGLKSFALTVSSDLEAEAEETLTLSLTQLTGSGLLATAATANVALHDSACNAIIGAQSAGDVHLVEPCYHLTGNLELGPGNQLTSVPGATLVAAAGTGIVIREGASISLLGTAERPITLRGADSQPGFWSGLELRDSDANTNGLQHTHIRDANVGVTANSRSAVAQFSNNRLLANNIAARLPATMASRLDGTSSFMGNERDFVVLLTSNLNSAHFLPSLDVPYLTDGTIVVNGNLNVAAGTEVYFAQGDFLIVSTTGTLTAVGTVDAPIVFTGEQSVAGYWEGLHFSTAVNNASLLDYVHISYAGGDPTRPGNVAIYGGAPVIPITNSVISHSAGVGIWVSADQASINTEGTTFVDNLGQDVYYFN